MIVTMQKPKYFLDQSRSSKSTKTSHYVPAGYIALNKITYFL